ncbi:MAG: ABC transporter ATP-binding protein [Clostridia bacterium]|nr:ABC transporter ATP-binding protein [Clostridia bacterium]MBR0444071.1 ABC transporter ATP-binding protein [Clostridia bacterium]
MDETVFKKEEQQYVKLPHFGIPKLIPYLKPLRKVIWSMVALSLLGGLIDTVMPLFQQYALNHFVQLSALDTLLPFILSYVAVLLTQTIGNLISAYQGGVIEMSVDRDMRRAAFDHLQTLSFSYFNQNSVGYIHSRVVSDTERIGSLVSWSLMDGVWNITYIIGALVIMFLLNWKMGLLVLILVPLTAIALGYFQGRLVRLNRRVREINSQITSGFNEGIIGAKTTKTLVAEERMDQDFRSTSREMTRAAVKTGHFRSLFASTISFASYITLALVLWRGGHITVSGLMELGTLAAFTAYALNLMEPLQWVVRALSDLITVQVNIERFTRLMETESDVSDRPEVIERYGDTFHPKKENWEELYGDVEFRDVSFMYPDGHEYVLEHFNLKIPQGTNVAVVGETGAGKSTLVNLVCRFFEPSAGQILIDGKDVRERSQLWLHSNIGYVLQTPHLFSGTIKENLLYGKPDATMREIEAAVKAVSADGIIARMEKGYDSDVGEGGDLLSTGEKQLLSFARAILSDPRIFVLDEATSSIDTVTEKLIQDAIEHLMKGRTSFVVAHRLSTIRQADLILVVRDGKIIEQGTHSELMKRRGYYYALYTRQFTEELMNSGAV